MIVMSKKTTYGFDIRQQHPVDGQTSFVIMPSNLLLRLALAPLTVTFDSAARNLVRYQGRVPPMQWHDGRWKDLDARVEYAMAVAVAAYR